MEFENISQEDFSKKTKSGKTSVWTEEFKAELKSALDERRSSSVENQTFRIPMTTFLNGYTGNSKRVNLQAHFLTLKLIGIDYENDKKNRSVVQKNGAFIEVDFTKLK